MRPRSYPNHAGASQLDRGASSVRLFEIGCRLGDREHPTLGLLLAGERRPRAGKAAMRKADAFDAKAEVLALLEAPAPRRQLQVHSDAGRPGTGRSAKLAQYPKTVSQRRRASPKSRQEPRCACGRCSRRDLFRRDPAPRAIGHADVHSRHVAGGRVFAIVRLICLWKICSARSAAPIRWRSPVSAIRQVRGFDGLPWRSKSRSSPEKSFTEEQMAEISARVVAAAEKLGAKLRS